MSIEAMKMALEALEPDVYKAEWVVEQDIQKAITLLRKAIAEFDTHTMYREGYVNGYAFGEAAAKQKAIQEEALRNVQRIGQEIEQESSSEECVQNSDKYVHVVGSTAFQQTLKADAPVKVVSGKREWVELTAGEISDIWGKLPQTMNEEKDAIEFGFAIESALRSKNT
jgi:hypothetical protein